MLAWEETRAANPCVPTDHKGTYEYGGTTYELTPHQSGPSFDQCAKVVHLVLKLDMECGAPHVSPWLRFRWLLLHCQGTC